MQFLELSDVRKTNDPLRAHVSRLITAVGTPSFETELFDVAHDALRCPYVTAFVAGGDAPPRVVLAAGTGDATVARTLAGKYVAQYWDLDPVNRTLHLSRTEDSIALRIAPEIDISDDFYRRDCYTQPQISERLTLTQRRGSRSTGSISTQVESVSPHPRSTSCMSPATC